MDSKVSEKDMREVYFQAFGKEYDSADRKQAPLPIEIAYLVALQKLEREGKYAGGGEITDDSYYQSVNHFVYFCLNYSDNFYDAFDSHLKNHLSNKFKDYYNKYGVFGVMMKFYAELDAENRTLFTNWILKNYKGSPISSDISEKEYHNIVNHFFYFAMNYPSNFLDAFSSYLRPHLSEKWTSAFEKKGSMGAMVQFWSELDTENRKDFCVWIKKNYTGTPLYELGGGLGDVAGMLPSPLPMSTIQPMADGGSVDDFDSTGTSMVIYHEKEGNFMIPKGQIYLYLYDIEKSGKKIQSGEFDWVFYPFASLSMIGQKGFIPPLKRIWTKKFQKEHKGSEHLLGVIKAFLIDKENGEKELYIDMMSVNPTKKKKGIMSFMIKDLRNNFNLSQNQVTFSQLTKDGEKFVEKGKYEDGGLTNNDLRILLPKEKMIKLLKENKFKSFDSSEIEIGKFEYDTNTYNPFITNFRLTIDCFPCIIVIDQVSDNAYEVKIAKDDGWIGGIYKDSWEYIFEIPKLNYEEFEKGLKKVINDKIITLYNYVDFVKTFYFEGTIEEAEKFAKKNGFKNEYYRNEHYDYVKQKFTYTLDKKRGIRSFSRKINNPSLSRFEPTETYLYIGTATKRQIEQSRSDNWGKKVSGGIKKLEKYSDGGKIDNFSKDEILIINQVLMNYLSDAESNLSYYSNGASRYFNEQVRGSLPAYIESAKKKVSEIEDDIKYFNEHKELPYGYLDTEHQSKLFLTNLNELPKTNNGREIFKNEIYGDEYYEVYEKLYDRLDSYIDDKFDIKYSDGGDVEYEVVLWGVKVGEPNWAEQILTKQEDKIEVAKKWAEKNGFDRFRISKIKLDKPDFTKTFSDGGDVYDSKFKEGVKVETTVFMSTEDIGSDEDIEAGTIGTVLSEPNDEEDLVLVEIKGVRHYLPQDVLEVFSEYNNDDCINLILTSVNKIKPIADFGISDKKLIIIVKEQLTIDEIELLNNNLKNIKGCSEITDDEFTISYKENNKTLILNLKTDDFSIQKFKNGGGVNVGYNVFNYTDNIYATDEVFKTKALANKFIKEFRNRFANQGYYRDNRMNKINIQDIDLLAIPSDFNPLKKYADGGGVGKLNTLQKRVYESVKNRSSKSITTYNLPNDTRKILEELYYMNLLNRSYIKDTQEAEYTLKFADGGGVKTDYFIAVNNRMFDPYRSHYRVESSDVFNGKQVYYDLDGEAYTIDENNYTEFKSGDMALQSSQHDMVIPVYFNENDEDADNEDFVNNTHKHVKLIPNFNKYYGEWHKDKSDAEKELKSLENKFSDGGGVGKKSDRNETQENNFGISYKLGDKFTLGKNFGKPTYEEVSITEIMPSGLFFKVNKSDKTFSIKTLHSKGSTYTSGEYLVPIKNQYSDGGEIKEGDRVLWRGNDYILSKIKENMVAGFRDTKYHLTSTKKGVEDANLDSLRDVKKVSFKNGGGVDVDLEDNFKKALVTSNFTYYTNDSDGIRMFRNSDNEELTGGVFAENSLTEDIENNDVVWASEDMKYNIDAMREKYSLGGILLSVGAGAFAYKLYLDYKKQKDKKRLEDFIKDEAKYYSKKIKSKINIDDDFQEDEERASRRMERDSDDMFQEREERASRRMERDSDDMFQERE